MPCFNFQFCVLTLWRNFTGHRIGNNKEKDNPLNSAILSLQKKGNSLSGINSKIRNYLEIKARNNYTSTLVASSGNLKYEVSINVDLC